MKKKIIIIKQLLITYFTIAMLPYGARVFLMTNIGAILLNTYTDSVCVIVIKKFVVFEFSNSLILN